MVKSRKKKITVYLTTENEQLLDEYRQSQGKIQYSRAVNEILGEFFEQQDGRLVEERLGEVEERLFEVEEELTHRRRSPDYRQEIEQLRSHVNQMGRTPDYHQEIEQLRSQVTQLTERCDRLMAINHEQKQALLQAQHRERQFCQQLSQTLETVQTQGTPPSDPQNTTEPEDEAFDILDAELVDNSAEDLLFKLSQELGLIWTHESTGHW